MDWRKAFTLEEEEQSEGYSGPTTYETYLFMIESSPTLLQGTKLISLLFHIYELMKRKVVTSPKDSVGVMVYNVENTASTSTATSDSTPPHCNVFVDLKQLNVKSIRDFGDEISALNHDPELRHTLFPPSQTEPHALAGALSHALSLLRQTPDKSRRRIFLVTDVDDPYATSAQLAAVAHKRARDLSDLGCRLEAFFLPGASQFDIYKFYRGIFVNDEATNNGKNAGGRDNSIKIEAAEHGLLGDAPLGSYLLCTDSETAIDEIIESLKLKESVKRRNFSIPFILSPGLAIGIEGYSIVHETKLPLPTKVDLATAEGRRVVSKTFYAERSSGKILTQEEIKKYYKLGEEVPIYEFFTLPEVRKIRTLDLKPSLKFMGSFKRSEYKINFRETVGHSYFIYPSEFVYEGSTKLFSVLLRAMERDDRVGLGLLLTGNAAIFRLVLMIPELEQLSPTSQVIRSSGFHVCLLPFADDFRPHNIDYVRTPDVNMLDSKLQKLCEKVIKKMTMDNYYPSDYENPVLQHFYGKLESLALNTPFERANDTTVPDYASIMPRIEKYTTEINELIPEVKEETKFSLKHGVPEDDDLPSKKPKIEPTPEAYREASNELVQCGGTLTVEELKGLLRDVGEPSSGLKNVLIERLKAKLRSVGHWDDKKEELYKQVKKRERAFRQ